MVELSERVSRCPAAKPKTGDGLVECFHYTFTSLLAKTTSPGGLEWDKRLPYALFSYCCSMQQSIGESSFFLLCGHNPQLPTEKALSKPSEWYYLDRDDYLTELVENLSGAWK